MRVPRVVVTWFAMAAAIVGIAQQAAAQFEARPRDRVFWTIAGAAITGTALLDERARPATLDHRSRLLDDLADAGNQLGRGRNLIAAMTLTYLVARVTHRHRVASGVLRVAAGYTVSNAIVSVLKPVVARHRPDSTNDAWRFHGIGTAGTWHSFPSSHAVHAFSLAAGAALVSRNPWVARAGYTAATVVAWSRLYADQHWASDVTTSAVIGIATAATTIHWLDGRAARPEANASGR